MANRFRLLLIMFICFPALLTAQGLRFNGVDFSIDERTSYDVFGDDLEVFSEDINLQCDVQVFPGADLGYILSIMNSKDESRIWNVSFDEIDDEKVQIRFNEEFKRSIIIVDIPKSEFKYKQWVKFSLRFDLIKDSVHFHLDDRHYSALLEDLPDTFSPEIVFGKRDHLIEVPSFAIRNLIIYESREGGKSFKFPLNASSGTIVDDDKFRIQGKVQNPVWLSEGSMRWHKETDMKSSQVATCGYNVKESSFYLINKDSVFIYNIPTQDSFARKMYYQCPVDMVLGSSIVSPVDSCIYIYELYNSTKTPDSPSVVRLDKDIKKWNVLSYDQMPDPMHHHSPFFLPETNQLLFFGGFGNQLYNGSFYILEDEIWKEIWQGQEGDTRIFPRYFSSVGLSEDGRYLYIFGGMGNECGEQIVGRRYFYDLHRVDVKTGRKEKLWELDWHGESKVPVRNMIIEDDYIYVMCYSEYKTQSALILYRFSIKDGTYETFGTEIPINSDKITTNANLYYDKTLSKLFVTVHEFPDDLKSRLSIYSLSFPPLKEAVSSTELWFLRSRNLLIAILSLVVLFASGAAIFGVVLHKRRRDVNQMDAKSGIAKRQFRPERINNSICLFGDFKVIDPQGNDISSTFSLQQQTILFLLLKRIDENGMSSKRISNVLWPDKDEDKVKNSRGVALNGLRRALAQLEGVSIVYRDGRYHLEVEDCFHCDYLDVLKADFNDKISVERALNAIGGGKFLSIITDPVFDSFKEKVESKAEAILTYEISKRFENKEYKAVVEIANMLVNIDPLDETALKLSIQALKRLKDNEEALVRYSQYTAEYKRLYDSEYSVPYNKI